MGLVGTVIDAAIGCLVQSILGCFFTGQMEAWTREVGLAEDVEKLESEMRNMEMVLAAAEGRRIESKPLAQSLDGLRELIYDAEDVMDELDYYRLQQQIEQGKGCSAAPRSNHEASYASSSTPSSPYQLICSARNQITSWVSFDKKRKREEEEPTDITMLPLEIKCDISKRINGIANNLKKTGSSVEGFLQLEISRLILTSNQSQRVTRNTRLTTSFPIEPKVYGRDADRDRIIELLINEGSGDLSVLPIVGIGGIGKTTLARFVYRDQKIIDHFDLQMWICVSTDFNEVRITLEILEHVCKDRQEYKGVSSLNELQEILSKNIRNKRFLLILDDMWEDKNRSRWETLLAPLKHSGVTGCMVLATTRRNSVAEMIGTMNAFQVSGLDEKEFWLFFKACAFGNENYEGHHYLQSIGQQIAKALKGCPLAARSVGALLNRNVSCEHWTAVQDKWKSLQVKDDDIIPILKLSYDYLPFHLQRCFSYCSLFPEDHQFNGETLVQAWISQNFVQYEDTGRGLEETGLQYLASLVDFGFFQKVESHYAMHDLMHELAEQVSSNECVTINGSQSKPIRPGIRHLSIIIPDHGFSSFSIAKFDEICQKIRLLQKLRSLMFFARQIVIHCESIQTLCKEAKCLRLLRVYLSSDSTYIHLNPYHLRYLELICNIEVPALPRALTSFYHLQVLNVGIYRNKAVPADMNNLVNLRHLIAPDKVHRAIACVRNMTSLQELKFNVKNIDGFEIRQLQSMNELVTLRISNLENVMTKEEASGAKLIDKVYLRELFLDWDSGSISLEPERTKDVLEGLQPHQNLKYLHITGYSGPASPTWLSRNISVTSLHTLHLKNCREWQNLGSLEMLPSLRKLNLIEMWNLVELSIPSLEELILIGMPKLEKCIGTYGIELTSHLRVLEIKDCPQLNEFTPFQSCSSFEAEQKSWFPSLIKFTIKRCVPIRVNYSIFIMGKSSKKSGVEVAPTAVSVPQGKSGKKGKRNAEDEIEKAVSAKKQKTAPEKVVPVKEDAKKVKKQPPSKKVESSSSEEDSSESEEEVKAQPKKAVQPKKAAQSAKQESSDDSSDDTSSDDEPANKPVACSNKPPVALATNSSSSDDSSDESSSDEEPVKKPAAPTKKPVALSTNGSKKVKESDSSSSDSSSDEESDEDDKKPAAPVKKQSVVPVQKKAQESDSSDSDSDDESDEDMPTKAAAAAKKKDESSETSDSGSDSDSDDMPTKASAAVKKKEESSETSDSESDSDSDDEDNTAKTVKSAKTVESAKASAVKKKEESSDSSDRDSESESESDSVEPAKPTIPAKRPLTTDKKNLQSKDETEDSSNDSSDSDESDEEPPKRRLRILHLLVPPSLPLRPPRKKAAAMRKVTKTTVLMKALMMMIRKNRLNLRRWSTRLRCLDLSY